jgi:hypothetical protein
LQAFQSLGTQLSRQGLPDPTTTPEMHRRHLPRERIPTARMLEHVLRDSEDNVPPYAVTASCGGGGGWPPKKASSVYGAAKVPFMPLLCPGPTGEGEVARDYREFRVWPERLNLFMPLPG